MKQIYFSKSKQKTITIFRKALENTTFKKILLIFKQCQPFMNYVNDGIYKIKFKFDILKSSNKSIFHRFFSFIHVYIYIKIFKDLSAKYCQENKERLQKKVREKARETYQNLCLEEKRGSMVVNVRKTSKD